MACFWKGILKQIKIHRSELPLIFQPPPQNPASLVKLFRTNNEKPVSVEVNGVKLSDQQMVENVDAVKNGYSEQSVNNGTLVSAFDPILILLCQLSGATLEHVYVNTTIVYRNTEERKKRIVFKFKSNKSHFWS